MVRLLYRLARSLWPNSSGRVSTWLQSCRYINMRCVSLVSEALVATLTNEGQTRRMSRQSWNESHPKGGSQCTKNECLYDYGVEGPMHHSIRGPFKCLYLYKTPVVVYFWLLYHGGKGVKHQFSVLLSSIFRTTQGKVWSKYRFGGPLRERSEAPSAPWLFQGLITVQDQAVVSPFLLYSMTDGGPRRYAVCKVLYTARKPTSATYFGAKQHSAHVIKYNASVIFIISFYPYPLCTQGQSKVETHHAYVT